MEPEESQYFKISLDADSAGKEWEKIDNFVAEAEAEIEYEESIWAPPAGLTNRLQQLQKRHEEANNIYSDLLNQKDELESELSEKQLDRIKELQELELSEEEQRLLGVKYGVINEEIANDPERFSEFQYDAIFGDRGSVKALIIDEVVEHPEKLMDSSMALSNFEQEKLSFKVDVNKTTQSSKTSLVKGYGKNNQSIGL